VSSSRWAGVAGWRSAERSGGVQLLNGADSQGPGEASASLRGDGSAGLIFLAPGSQGTTA